MGFASYRLDSSLQLHQGIAIPQSYKEENIIGSTQEGAKMLVKIPTRGCQGWSCSFKPGLGVHSKGVDTPGAVCNSTNYFKARHRPTHLVTCKDLLLGRSEPHHSGRGVGDVPVASVVSLHEPRVLPEAAHLDALTVVHHAETSTVPHKSPMPAQPHASQVQNKKTSLAQ